MNDITHIITTAQIATGITIIAFVLVFHVFRRDINDMLRKGKKAK